MLGRQAGRKARRKICVIGMYYVSTPVDRSSLCTIYLPVSTHILTHRLVLGNSLHTNPSDIQCCLHVLTLQQERCMHHASCYPTFPRSHLVCQSGCFISPGIPQESTFYSPGMVLRHRATPTFSAQTSPKFAVAEDDSLQRYRLLGLLVLVPDRSISVDSQSAYLI